MAGDSEHEVVHGVDPGEPLARYLTSKDHYSIGANKVKLAAFLPPKSLELSVFRIHDLSESDIWTIGERQVAVPQGKQLHGRAQLTARTVSASFRIVPDNDPPRHACIVGWPPEKEAQKALALQLADGSKLVLRVTGKGAL